MRLSEVPEVMNLPVELHLARPLKQSTAGERDSPSFNDDPEVVFLPRRTGNQPYELTAWQQRVGWLFPVLLVVGTIFASSLPGWFGDVTRQFFDIHR